MRLDSNVNVPPHFQPYSALEDKLTKEHNAHTNLPFTRPPFPAAAAARPSVAVAAPSVAAVAAAPERSPLSAVTPMALSPRSAAPILKFPRSPRSSATSSAVIPKSSIQEL